MAICEEDNKVLSDYFLSYRNTTTSMNMSAHYVVCYISRCG